jgi:hypothetical protein
MMTNFTSRFSASAIAEACDSDRRGEILLPIADVSHGNGAAEAVDRVST